MSKKPTYSNVTNRDSVATEINSALSDIVDGFDNTLSLDGSTPNAMNADLDLNNNDLLNVKNVNADEITIDGVDLTVQVANAAASATAAATSASEASTSETNAAASEAQAAISAASAATAVGRALFETVSDLTTDNNNVIGYTGSGAEFIVSAGDIVEASGFRYEVAASGASDEHVSTAGGVKLYIAERDKPTPFHFGAVGDGSTDDAVPLQAFFDTIEGTDFGEADITGDFATSVGLTFGSTGNAPATKVVRGHANIQATAAMDELLSLTECGGVEWDTLYLYGTGSTSFASRTVDVGVAFNNCGRQVFRKIYAQYFGFAGICAAVGNNSLSQFGEVKAADCGSGHNAGATIFGLTATWSNPVNAGSSGSVSQSTTIDVDTMPPDYLLNGDYGIIGDSPYLVRIDGYVHYIISADDVAGTLTVFPWVPSTATPGTLEYVFGGAVYMRGGDCNVNGFKSVDAIRCGTAITAGSLYGPRAERITTQYCGIGILVGRTTSAAALGGSYDNIYFEANDEDIIILMRTGTNAYNYFGAEYALDLSKVYCAGVPRLSSDAFSTSYEAIRNHIFARKGEHVQWEKASRNATDSAFGLTPTRRDQTLVYNRNTATFVLNPMDEDLNRVTGIDSATLICMGTGANKQPTGTITLSPGSGWTLNGGSSDLTFSGLVHAPIFAIQWNVNTQDAIVTHVNGAQAAFVADASSGSAAEINALRDALVNAGLMAAS